MLCVCVRSESESGPLPKSDENNNENIVWRDTEAVVNLYGNDQL